MVSGRPTNQAGGVVTGAGGSSNAVNGYYSQDAVIAAGGCGGWACTVCWKATRWESVIVKGNGNTRICVGYGWGRQEFPALYGWLCLYLHEAEEYTPTGLASLVAHESHRQRQPVLGLCHAGRGQPVVGGGPR